MSSRVSSHEERLPDVAIVMPVFNEESWIGRSVGAVLTAADASPWSVEVVVVDDGSTDGTAQVLARLAADRRVRVLSQPNSGRFSARSAGVTTAHAPRVLLLDSRVVLRPDALLFLANQAEHHPAREVWNGDVHVVTTGNPYAGFWAALVKVAWRGYAARPRLMSYGLEQFDAFPKGAGCFLAPREALVRGFREFRPLYEDVRLASDDTKLIRLIAERHRIWLAPDFACDYHGRTNLRGFLRHAHFRGLTFVDGYLQAPGPVRRAAGAAAGLMTVLAAVGRRRPVASTAAAGAVPLLAAGVARRSGATPAEARAVVLLMPPFALAFGSGAVRGLLLAARAARRSRS